MFFFKRQFLKSKSTRTKKNKTCLCHCDGWIYIKSKNRINIIMRLKRVKRIDTKAKKKTKSMSRFD